MWAQVADEVRELRRQRLGRLLTEETVRFAAPKALVRAGVDPDHMPYERPATTTGSGGYGAVS